MIATSAAFRIFTIRARSHASAACPPSAEKRKNGVMKTPVATVASMAAFSGAAR